jgi:hypothetical protein
MPAVSRPRSQRADRYDDLQPNIRFLGIALAAHALNHLARLGDCVVAMPLNPQMR